MLEQRYIYDAVVPLLIDKRIAGALFFVYLQVDQEFIAVQKITKPISKF